MLTVSRLATLASLLMLTSAAPLELVFEKRQNSNVVAAAADPNGLSDIDVLQLATSLEHLQNSFYAQGLQKFSEADFTAAGLTSAQYAALQSISRTEKTHVDQLSAAITTAGATPVQACTYDFNLTTATNMIATARSLEAIGLSAYLGGTPLVRDKSLLVAAGEISTVEARHQTLLRMLDGADPVPNAFDTPLGPRAVLTLARKYVTSCPPGSNLNVASFPSIALNGSQGNVMAGQQLLLAQPGQPDGAKFCAFINQGQSYYAGIDEGTCKVPNGMSGEVYILVTNGESLADPFVLAGPSIIEMS